MSDEGTTYQAGCLAAISFALRNIWSYAVNGNDPDPETDHRIGSALQGILSDEQITGKEIWAVPTIVGLGGGWNTFIGIHRASRAPSIADENLDTDPDSNPSDDGVLDSDDAVTVEGERNDESERDRAGYRRRRRERRED